MSESKVLLVENDWGCLNFTFHAGAPQEDPLTHFMVRCKHICPFPEYSFSAGAATILLPRDQHPALCKGVARSQSAGTKMLQQMCPLQNKQTGLPWSCIKILFDQTSHQLDISYLPGTILRIWISKKLFQRSCVHWNQRLFPFKLENFMTSVLGRSVKLVGETIVGRNLWGLWSADLRPNLISPLFAPLPQI